VTELLLILAPIGLLVWGVVIYNLLVRDRNRVAQAWSDVDVQLTRRHELVPRLVEIVKSYASYERALLESLAEMRARGAATSAPGQRGPVEQSLGAGMHRLIALAESYPDLKASGNFLDLQEKLVETENQIQYARRYYNGAVNNLNTRIEQFPDLIVARSFGFRRAELFDLDEENMAVAPRLSVA
jgi:LemA protein